MTKKLKPFYLDAGVISDDDVKEICKVVVSLGGSIIENEARKVDWLLFGVDEGLCTIWFDHPASYGNATHLKSMEEFREMFCEPVEENISNEDQEPSFTELMQQYINLYDQMPAEEDKQYIAQKMEQLCGKYTGTVYWMQLDIGNIKQINEETV